MIRPQHLLIDLQSLLPKLERDILAYSQIRLELEEHLKAEYARGLDHRWSQDRNVQYSFRGNQRTDIMHATHLSSSSLSVDDYLAGEESGELRHEYIDGQIYAMTGASDRHGLIVSNLVAALRPLIRGRGCQLFANDMKVRLRIADQDIFYYPDLLLSCEANDRETYFRTKPCLIVEVLSGTTERIDRREKFLAYTTLPSLQDYLLVSQAKREVWHYRRAREWAAEVLTDGDLGLECLGISLPLDVIYDEIEGLV